MLIAHFSDLHLTDKGKRYKRALRLVDDAADLGAEHLVFTGDLVDVANIGLLKAFVKDLGRRGHGTGKTASIVPGNHEIYPLVWPPVVPPNPLNGPQNNHNNFYKVIKPTRKGEGCGRLFKKHPLPFKKVLSKDVVLAGLDTTSSSANPAKWVLGEMDRCDIMAVRDFFREHGSAAHRILLMHHYPRSDFSDPLPWPFDMEFDNPQAGKVRWIKKSGATLVLCGHIHRNRQRKIGPNCRLVCASSSGRTYQLIELRDDGDVTVEKRRVNQGRMRQLKKLAKPRKEKQKPKSSKPLVKKPKPKS